jgi:hypothetical protein
MKLLKTLTMGLVAAATIGTASAQTVIHIAGSTAFRAPATAAMIDYLSNGGSTTVYAGYQNSGTSGLLGSSAAILANGTIPGGTATATATVILETYWTGSLAGVVDITAGNLTGKYLDTSAITTADINAINTNATPVTTSPYGGGYQITDNPTTITSTPDAAFSDSYAGTIAKELGNGATAATFSAPVGSYSNAAALAAAISGGTVIQDAGTSGGAAAQGIVGILPFEVCVGNVTAGTGSYTNIGMNAYRQLITAGSIPMSFITGQPADNVNYFYLVGRNEDSGSRIDNYSESQFGVTANPVQYQVGGYSGNNGGSTVNEKYPVTALNTEPNITWNKVGHSGYASGSNVSGALNVAEASGTISITGKAAANSGNSYFIGYLGITDAAGLSGNAKALSYNGVPYSQANVQNGSYSLWGFEHLYRLQSVSSTTAGNVIDAIADNVFNTDADISNSGSHTNGTSTASAGILFSSMNVTRAVNEGQGIQP